MAGKCLECGEQGSRAHLKGCSFGAKQSERDEYVKQHALQIVEELEEKIRAQAKHITSLEQSNRDLRRNLGG